MTCVYSAIYPSSRFMIMIDNAKISVSNQIVHRRVILQNC